MIHYLEAAYWRWKLKGKYGNHARNFLPWHAVKYIGVLGKITEESDVSAFATIIKMLEQEQKVVQTFTIIPQAMQKQWVAQPKWNVITRHNLVTKGFNLQITQGFVNEKFDLLINLHNNHPALLCQISKWSQAKFRLAFNLNQQVDYADLVINLQQTDAVSLWQAAKPYLLKIH